MELIERKWLEIRNRIKKLTLKRAMMYYVTVGLVAAFSCSFFVIRFAENWKDMICYLEETKRANTMIAYLYAAEAAALILILSASIFLVCQLFYRRRIEPGLKKIEKEILFLKREDLSYDCSYEGEDEIAAACQSLNAMRLTLIENRKNTWEVMEQLRLVNAAFAHDIRTPLTVMKGYIQMIEKFYPQGPMTPEKVMENLRTISRQIERMEQFSQTMKNMNHIGEWEPVYREMTPEKLLGLFQNDMAGMAEGEKIACSVRTGEMQRQLFFCDPSIIQEVADNLLLNALRYAVSEIVVTVEISEQQLFVYVQDDGPGFSVESLEKGSRPYFSTEPEHMGMGLSICKLLCKKHGGDLELTNSVRRGAIACAFFHIS